MVRLSCLEVTGGDSSVPWAAPPPAPPMSSISGLWSVKAKMVMEETAAVWTHPAGGGQRGCGAGKMELEGRLAIHLPACDFIKPGPAARALPAPHCCPAKRHGSEPEASPTSEIHFRLFPRGLGRHPPSDAKWRSVGGAQAIGTPASSHFPASSPACLLPGKLPGT